MNIRLQEIIKYKTGGRKTAFAELMGWTPQYLAKLLNGENFGLQPVLSILEKLPEINARWFLFGQGSMLEIGKMFDLQRETMNHIQELLDLDKYIPYMSPGWWMFSRKTGEMKAPPLFFSNTPDTAFSFVPAVTYCLTNDSPTVAFIRRCSAGRVCCQAVQPYRCRFSYTRSRRAFPLICAAADRPA